MILKKLRLQNFRNYSEKEFEFSEKTTLIVGPNTSGKTNLLEAIYLLSTGKSFRADLEQEMIDWESSLARVKGRVTKDHETIDLEIILTRGEIEGERVSKKKCLLNGVGKRMMDFVGNLRAVYFGPEDLDLITDSPSLRRKYLDLVLAQVDREYGRSSLSYEKGLRQRNKLLERIREEGVSRLQLLFWNQLLIRNGQIITQKRQEFIEFINGQELTDFNFRLIYDKSIISPARLSEYAEEEVAAGATLVGPHRDDFSFQIGEACLPAGRDLSVYGSRGEQRLAILWLKLGELEFITQKTDGRPLLLLDDIFSELDQEHRHLVFSVIPEQQTIITTTDLHLIEKDFLKKINVVELFNKIDKSLQ